MQIAHTIAQGIITIAVSLSALFGYHGGVATQQDIQAVRQISQQTSLGSDNFNPVGGKNYFIYGGGIGASDVTIPLTSFTAAGGSQPLTMSNFGSKGCGTLEPGNVTRQEFISFTGVSQNDDGTATLSGVSRGLLPIAPYTASSTYTHAHSGGSKFILSNTPPCFYESYTAKDNDETITGLWTVPTPLANAGIANKAYVDNLVNGGPVSIDAVLEAATAGETIVAGNLIYFDTTQNEWMKTDADTLSTLVNVKLGIAQGSGTNGNPISGGVLTTGTYTTSGLTKGDTLFASNTAGGISSTTGTNPRVIGLAIDSTHLYFDPNFQSDLYHYAVDSVGTDAYAITISSPSSGAFDAYYTGEEVTFKAGTANTGAATLNVNNAGAKTIKKNSSDSLETGDILVNQIVSVVYDGTNFQLVSPSALTNLNLDYQSFTTSGTWTKPSSATGTQIAVIQVWGAGAGGGGTSNNTGNNGSGGGGGGAFIEIRKLVSDLGSTESVTIGAGGAGGAAGAANNGVAGGTSSFGSYVSAFGGSFGVGTTGGANGAGGGGGGALSQGSNGVTTTGGAGGAPGGGAANTLSSSGFGGGGGGNQSQGGGSSLYGGGGGGGGDNTGHAGGSSLYGGGGGAGGAYAGGAGVAGGVSQNGGNGGASGTESANGGVGSAPGGGGGGAGSNPTQRAGGSGARGEVRVWIIRS